MKKKFTVEICRTSYAFETFEVEADNEAEAVDKAQDMAYNTIFREKDAEYLIDGITCHQ